MLMANTKGHLGVAKGVIKHKVHIDFETGDGTAAWLMVALESQIQMGKLLSENGSEADGCK